MGWDREVDIIGDGGSDYIIGRCQVALSLISHSKLVAYISLL